MSVLKLSKKDITINNSDDNKIKLKKGQLSYDSAMISGWETTNKESYNIISTINEKLNNNEFLTADDIASYRTATDNYIKSTNNLRGLYKVFGEGYSDDEEKAWTDYTASAMSNIDSIADFYSNFNSEDDYNSYIKGNKDKDLYNKYLTEYGSNSEAGMAGFDQYITDRNNQVVNRVVSAKDFNKDGDVALWEDILYTLAFSGMSSDTSLPTAPINQAIHDTRLYGKQLDTSTWTDEQKAVFGNLYATDKAKALELANIINKLNKEAKIKEISESATSDWGSGIGHSIAAVFASTTGLIDTLNNLVEYNALGTITDGGSVSPYEYSQAVIGSVSSKLNESGVIDESIPVIGGKGWGDVYSLGTSILQSATAGTIGGGWGSLVLLGGSAAASGIDDALSRGATTDQAFGYGVAVGLAEGIAEKIGIDNLTDLIFKKGSTTILKSIAKQFIAEGAEEGVTSFVDGFIDNLVMGDKSNFNALVNQYMAQGMSESEATSKAWQQYGYDLIYDAVAGGISGAAHAGGAIGIQKGLESILKPINAKQLYGANQQELINEGLSFGQGTKPYEIAKKYQGTLDSNLSGNNLLGHNLSGQATKPNSNKSLSGTQLYNLSNAIEKAILSGDTTKIKNAAETRLQNLGETSNASELAEIIAKQVKGETLSKKEKNILENSRYGQRVINELNPENIESGMYSSAWTGNIGTDRINSELYNLAQETVKGVEPLKKNVISSPPDDKEEKRTDSVTVSDDGKTTIIKDGERVEVSVKEIASIKDGVVSVRLDNGEVVDAKDVEYSTEEEGLIYEAVADMNAATANAFVKGFKEGKNSPDLRVSGLSLNEYINGFNEAYKYGAYRFPSSEMSRDGFSASLSEEQRHRAYELGRIDREAFVKAKQTNINKKVEDAKKSTVSSPKKENKILREDGTEVDLKELKAKATKDVQTSGIEVIEFLTSVLSGKYYIFESYKNSEGQLVYKNAKGVEEPAPNGYFRDTDGSLHIDLNAGEGALQGIMLNTLAHEQGHFIAENNAEGFKLLSDYIVNYLNKKGENVDDLVVKRLKAKRSKGRYQDMSDTEAYEAAFEDVICDGLETIYHDGAVLDMINELKTTKKGKNVIQQLFEKLKELINKIVDAYKGKGGRTDIGKHVATMSLEELRGLQKIFAEALVKADEAHEAIGTVESTTEGGKVKFQLKETFEETKELVAVHNMTQEQLLKSLDLGGLPMPSIAIIKAKDGHSEYGDVSLVFQKDTIDPKANVDNKVYGGDAWTPVYPKIEFKPNEKVEAKIREKYYSLAKKFSYDEARPLYNYANNLEDALNSYKSEEALIKKLLDDTDMMQLYLLDIGKDKIETVQKETRTELSDAEVQQHEFFIKELGESVIDEVKAPEGAAIFNHRKEYVAKYGSQIEQAYRKLMTDVYKFSSEEVQNVIDQETDYTLLKKIRDAYNYRQKGRVTVKTEADYSATREKIRNAVNPKEYQQWLTDLFKGVIEKSGIRNNKDYFDYYGNARSWEALHWANNLTNVVRAMKQQNNGDVSFFSGLGIWGVSAKEYQSIDDIRADKDRLKRLSTEEYKAIKEGFGERLTEIATSIMSKSEDNYFIALDNAMECIVDAVRTSKTKSGILRNLKQYTQLSVTETTVSDIVSLVSDISQMPTEYFEAKPQRAVGFKEVATAIIPNDSSVELKEALKKQGVPIKEYQQGNSEDRLKALNSIENVKFSDRDSEGNTLSKEQQEFFKDSKVKDENGNLIVLYHGSKADANEFRKEFISSWNMFGKGYYFTSSERRAKGYAKGSLKKVYLNITNPFFANERDYLDKIYPKINNTQKDIEEYSEEKGVGGREFFKICYYLDDIGVDVSRILQDLGFDGVYYEGYEDIEVVAYDSNQIKLTSNKNPTSDSDIRYSDRESYAPTFYSQMGKVVEGMKQDKFSANSVVPMLRGRGVKAEEIRWSGIVMWLENKKSVSKQELLEFIAGSQLQIGEQMSDTFEVEVVSEDGDNWIVRDKKSNAILDEWEYSDDVEDGLSGWVNQEGEIALSEYELKEKAFKEFSSTRWSQYKLEGGNNYREIVFTMPNSSYSNQMMRIHWGDDAEGVLAHARIQDFIVDGKKMLFVEEIQSDWHNEGHLKGYEKELSSKEEKRVSEIQALIDEKTKERNEASKEIRGLPFDFDEKILESLKAKRDELTVEIRTLNDELFAIYGTERKGELDLAAPKGIPNAPFKDTYHEYVLKRLLRKAAEEGYDSIGWTPAEIQDKRWSDGRAHEEGKGHSGNLVGYTIEYDQEMPKFLKKYGRQWGAKVEHSYLNKKETLDDISFDDIQNKSLDELNNGTEIWSMELTDSMKDSVLNEGQVLFSDREYTPLEDRVSGDNLLNAQDLIETVKSVGGIVDSYGYITLYHRTSRKNAENIRNTGIMQGKEDGLFFSTSKDGQAEGYGDTVVEFSIPAEKLVLDDLFDNEAHLRLPIKNGRTMNVGEYIRYSERDTALNRNFSYDELVAKGDLQGTVINKNQQVKLTADGSIDAKNIVSKVRNECQVIQTKSASPTYFLHVPDIGRNVQIVEKSITHGFFDSTKKNKTPSPRDLVNAKVSLVLPEILANSIEVNRSYRKGNLDVPYSHIMMGTVALEDANGNLEYYAVRSVIEERVNQNPILVEAKVLGKLHAVNAKKIDSSNLKVAKNSVARGHDEVYKYSIADFLQDVNQIFDDTFSLDVYKHLNTNRKNNEFSKNLLYQDRDLDLLEQKQKVIEVLAKEADKLKEDNQYLKELVKLQRKVTHGTVFTKSSVEIVATKLLKNADARGNKAELVKLLNEFYGYIAKADNLAWEDISEKAQPVIDWLKKNKVKRPIKLDAEASALLKELREKRIYLDKDQQSEAAYVYGSFYEFRKKAMGSLTIVSRDNPNGAKALESVWMELADKYPAYFDLETISASMPARLLEIIERLRNYQDDSAVYDYSEEMVNQDLLNQVYDSYWDVSTLHTAADSAQKQINLLKYKHHKKMAEVREYHKEKHNQLKNEYKEKIARIKKDYRDRSFESTEQFLAKRTLQKLILKTAKWISYPAKGDVKCPDILRKPYADFLESIDLSSKRALKGGEATQNDLRIALAMNSLATAVQQIKTAQDPTVTTDNILDAGYLDLPAQFVENLREQSEKVKGLMDVKGDYVINRMPSQDIKDLVKVIHTLNHAIKEMSTLYSNARFSNIEELGNVTTTFLDSMGEAESTSGIKDFVTWDNALPYYAFKRFGEGGESIFEELMDAQDKLAFNAKKIFEFKEKTWTDKESKAWSEDVHTIELTDGKSVTLTTADAMGIYCLSRRSQAVPHLLGGGIRVIGIKKGLKKASDSHSTLNLVDIGIITKSLDRRQIKVAEAIQDFMSNECSEWGNEISMKRFLTREFNETHYYPIESNDENLPQKDPQAQQSDLYRLLNISATKPTIKGANNEVIIRNIFDVFTNHSSDMARLNAYGMALLDYMKWVNYREKIAKPNSLSFDVRGVVKSMGKTYGDKAKSYVINLIKDINGRSSDGGDNALLMKMMRMAKTAAVGFNARVAMLQLTSYPRAGMVLSQKSLAAGLTKMPNIKMAKKYCGIALWKSYGFYDTNIARSIEDQLKGTTNIRQKLIELSLKGAEWGDAITWGALWNACEYEVKKTTKNKVGSEEFYQEVGKKLREVVYATQVVDSTLTRTQIMRSKSGLTQTATSFMSEPSLTANIVMDATFEFEKAKRISGSAKEAWRKTGKLVTQAVAITSSIAIVTAIVESLFDAWRDDDDEEFIEKLLDALGGNLISNIIPFNKIPILSDFVDLILSQFGIGYYSSDNLAFTFLTDCNKALKAWGEVLSEDTSSTTVYNALYKTVKAISSATGISASSLMREVVALWNNTIGAIDPTLKILQYSRTTKEVGNLVYDAIVKGDKDLVKKLKSEFKDEDSYKSALRKALRENDPRIRKAAQAIIDGNQAERIRITREIVAEGHFNQDIVVGAINSELTALKKELKES